MVYENASDLYHFMDVTEICAVAQSKTQPRA
jgi:hypothetical protein